MKKMIKWISLVAASAFGMMLFACVPSGLEKAENKLAREGYNVTVSTKDGVEYLYATKLDDNETEELYAYRFDSKNEAKTFYKNKKAELLSKGLSSPIQEGKWVYVGTPDAIEDFED